MFGDAYALRLFLRVALRKTAFAQLADYFGVLLFAELVEEEREEHERRGNGGNDKGDVVIIKRAFDRRGIRLPKLRFGNVFGSDKRRGLIAESVLDVRHRDDADIGEHEHERIEESLDETFEALTRFELLIVGQLRHHQRLQRRDRVEQSDKSE